MAEKTTQITPREQNAVSRSMPRWAANPMTLLEQLATEMEGMFHDFGLIQPWFGPRVRKRWLTTQLPTNADIWAPNLEVSQQNNELVVRADLPGIKKDDVHVDITDREITISGERRREQRNEQGQIYRSEREYGSFRRTLLLPDGVKADQAKATCKAGVLEIRIPTPERGARRRRLEIQETTQTKK